MSWKGDLKIRFSWADDREPTFHTEEGVDLDEIGDVIEAIAFELEGKTSPRLIYIKVWNVRPVEHRDPPTLYRNPPVVPEDFPFDPLVPPIVSDKR